MPADPPVDDRGPSLFGIDLRVPQTLIQHGADRDFLDIGKQIRSIRWDGFTSTCQNYFWVNGGYLQQQQSQRQ